MKTNTTPQRAAIRAIGVSVLAASLIIVAVVSAQDSTPGAAAPPAEDPAGEPAPAVPGTGRIPVPAAVEGSGSRPGVDLTTPVNPATTPDDSSLIDPRTKSIIRTEKDSNGVTRTIVRTILDEEVSSNPQEAARNYEAVIAAFDSQRANAAQAIFRLGETYRRLNRLDEARVQYARILREFVDFPDLASLSQKQLSQNPPAVVSGGGTAGDGLSVAGIIARAAATSAEERKLLHEEIHLLEGQLAETQRLVQTGVVSAASLVPIQREILQLKRQLLRHENSREPAPALNALDPSITEAPAATPKPPTPQPSGR